MKYDEKTEVEFGFMAERYWRDGEGVHEIKGRKTLKLFKSWFRLMRRRGKLLYGYVKFIDSGEAWIWQHPSRVYNGGWHKALRSKYDPVQLSLDFQA